MPSSRIARGDDGVHGQRRTSRRRINVHSSRPAGYDRVMSRNIGQYGGGRRDLEKSPQRPNLQVNLLAMYFERLLVGNVRYLGSSAHDFAIGPGRLRRWNLFPAGSSSSALLRALALAGLGQRQLERLAQRSPLYLAERADQPPLLTPSTRPGSCAFPRSQCVRCTRTAPGRVRFA